MLEFLSFEPTNNGQVIFHCRKRITGEMLQKPYTIKDLEMYLPMWRKNPEGYLFTLSQLDEIEIALELAKEVQA